MRSCCDPCLDTPRPLACEWLDTNGGGGYASSTLANCNTRKYHGLLVANLPPPAAGRHVLLAATEDRIAVAGADVALAWRQYPGVLVPAGDKPAMRFVQTDVPTWEFGLAGGTLRRRLGMLAGRDAVVLEYTSQLNAPAVLRLRPFLAFRRNHDLARENGVLNGTVQRTADGFCVAPYTGMPPLWLQVAPSTAVASVLPEGYWHRRVEFATELERGYPGHEDWFGPALLEIALPPGGTVLVAASTCELRDVAGLWATELAARAAAVAGDRERARRLAASPALAEGLQTLLRAARQFRVRTPSGRPAVLAGYHWFEDWGRDTLISLPGLTFLAGEMETGLEIMASLVAYERDGLLPNFIGPREDAAAYNSIDASLWLFWAVQQYLRAGGSGEAVRQRLWPTLRRMLAALAEGRAGHGIGLTSDGLLRAGTPDTQLTWMDAFVDGRPVTPRWGCAVEINALWYNALCLAEQLACQWGDGEWLPPVSPARVAASFRARFWLPADRYLADVVNDVGTDRALRPNQVLAVSLPYSPLTPPMRAAVLRRLEADLLTPFGLRTLSPADPAYGGRYAGGCAERDHAYHQGTVWPWLLGPYGEARLRVSRGGVAARRALAGQLARWSGHLGEAGIGSVSEVFDGDPPHTPGGCVAQAWSVAELIRLHVLLAENRSCAS